jgi:hypothetical protein
VEEAPEPGFVVRSSGLAVIGFVLAFLWFPLSAAGLVVSAVALWQCRRARGKLEGAGLALAGIAVALINIGIWWWRG